MTQIARDPWDDPEAKAWVAHTHETLVPMIEGSSVTVSLCPRREQVDVKFAVELGLSIMMEKPIIALAREVTDVPPRLAQLADYVVIGDLEDPDVRAEMLRAINSVHAKLDAEE